LISKFSSFSSSIILFLESFNELNLNPEFEAFFWILIDFVSEGNVFGTPLRTLDFPSLNLIFSQFFSTSFLDIFLLSSKTCG